jgi:hypothetical protein
MSVRLGSPAETARAMLDFGQKRISDKELFFVDGLSAVALPNRFAAASGAEELAGAAVALGLDISERTAHRILQGSIAPAPDVLRELEARRLAQGGAAAAAGGAGVPQKGLKISKGDMDLFARKLEEAFEVISERYYVSLLESPKISVSKSGIKASFEIDREP